MVMMLDFEDLLEKFLREELTPEELKVFLENGETPVNQEVLRRVLGEKLTLRAYQGLSEQGRKDELFQQMLEKANTLGYSAGGVIPLRPQKNYRRVVGIAAAILLMLGTAVYWMNNISHHPMAQKEVVTETPKDITPGGNKAILTLSNGSKIILDSVADGILARQGNTSVVKLANGQLSYQEKAGTRTKDVLYNTMSTPRGGQYKLILPDGTQVWLNASSAIVYPTAFAGSERKVQVSGEAYFEVVPNVKMPFKVTVNGVTVNVLGTHFNVNAYGDEATTRITLLEGAIKITKGIASSILKPGQQAQVTRNNEIKFSEEVDVEEVVAWKNGLFWFNGVDLPGIMRQLSRWYDIEVQYEGPIPQRHFTGHVFRYLNLSEVLKILALSHVHFRIEGKKLIVTP
jgi:transmembrane sensor